MHKNKFHISIGCNVYPKFSYDDDLHYFWNVLIFDTYITGLQQLKPIKISALGFCIIVVHSLTCALHHLVRNLKVVSRRLIWKLILCESELGNYDAEVSKNIFCTKDESIFNHRTVTKKFHSGRKNVDAQSQVSWFRGCAPSHIIIIIMSCRQHRYF